MGGGLERDIEGDEGKPDERAGIATAFDGLAGELQYAGQVGQSGLGQFVLITEQQCGQVDACFAGFGQDPPRERPPAAVPESYAPAPSRTRAA